MNAKITTSHTQTATRPPARGGSRGVFRSGPSRGGSFGGSQGGSRGGFRSGGRGGSRGGRRGGMGERIDVAKFKNKASTSTEPEVAFVPVHTFNDFAIHDNLKKAIASKGYTTPTPIQDQAIPSVLLGKDVLGIANTGTGKTGAFLIPLINKVGYDRTQKVLVIVPTRELAIQVDSELLGFTRGMGMFSVCAVGGMSIGKQISQLRSQYNFVIGTPGRLKDLVDRKMIRLNEFKTVVLDEADRMLDMGFINDMREVMAGMPTERQTLFFSATLSPDIEKLINEFLKDPVRVFLKKRDTSKDVDQDVVQIRHGENKVDVLQTLLKEKDFNKVLIFGRTKHGVERLTKILTERGFKAESIHGNKNHAQRQRALSQFKDNHVQVLVATDVAARGLDIPNVSHVINFELPQTYDDYVHRIGRTGRGGNKGKALTFIE